jgi:hypothetical protein
VGAAERPWTALPELSTGKIKGRNHNVPAAQKGDINPIPVGKGRAGGKAVLPVLFFQGRLQDGLLPEQISIPSIYAHEQPFLPLPQRARQEYAISPNNGGGVAHARHGCLPDAVALHVPNLMRDLF